MNIDNYVFINQAVLKIVGLYPINIVRYIICTSCIMLIIIPQVIEIYESWENFNLLLETSSVLLTILLAVLKSLIWIFNRKNLEIFVNFMLTDYWKEIKSDVFKHLEVYAIYAKNITKGYLFLMCNALLFFFSLPVIEILINIIEDTDNNLTVKHFPFVASYPMFLYEFPFYQITYVSQMLATSMCCLVMLATDTLIATALFHTCGHFRVVEENLKQLDANICRVNSLKRNLESTSKNLYEIKAQINYVIKHHQIVLWFCDNMEKNFHPILLLQTLASSLLICFVGFQVSTTFTERSEVIKYLSHLMVALFQLLLFCSPGNMLIYQSFNVSRAVYSIRWYDMPTLIKNEICLISLRGQKASYVTAGKLYVMHLENFSAILSTALSYFMMLRSFNIEA